MLNNNPETPKLEKRICPHLGLLEDEQTCLAYPSRWNICHHAQPASAVGLEHQRMICLLPAHTSCPVFQSEEAMPLPEQLRGHRHPISSRKKA